MNKTARTNEPLKATSGCNQSPDTFSNDLVTNDDFNDGVNSSASRGQVKGSGIRQETSAATSSDVANLNRISDGDGGTGETSRRLAHDHRQPKEGEVQTAASALSASRPPSREGDDAGRRRRKPFHWLSQNLRRFLSFIGPGFMISVAYIDPGNYATDIAAGASYRFRLLFIVLLSNLFAIFLQSLAIKLGTVTGLNLAEACRAFLPRWLNYILYFFAEAAIIATDIAEVIGFAIALNLLAPKVPLVAGCAISILDVMVILFFYRPEGSMKSLRIFEGFVICLVLGVVVCFCIQLSLIHDTAVGQVFRGYVPSSQLIESKAIYQACGILGATVMPHSLYLGSGIVQPRLLDFDKRHGLLPSQSEDDGDDNMEKSHYVPSLPAIQHSLKVSVLELSISLFTFALFVNSAILIVAGAALYNNPDALDADIFGIHKLLSQSISSAAGTIFALALLLSGISAGIVCTIAGQMVSEGALNWKVRPWLRRLITRSISITPSIIIAGAVGQKGLNDALNASQVVLSIILPFVTAPLIYFTCLSKYMTVNSGRAQGRRESSNEENVMSDGDSLPAVSMANSWYAAILAVMIWLFMSIMNVANLVFLGKD